MGGFYFLFYSTYTSIHHEESPGTFIDENFLSDVTIASLRKKYPHLQPHSVEWAKSQREKPTHTWDEWIDTNVKLNMNGYIALLWESSELSLVLENLEKYDTPEKLQPVEANLRKFYEEQAKGWQNQGGTIVPPTVNGFPPDYLEALEAKSSDVRVGYEGPQTPDAIMDRFDALFSGSYSDSDSGYSDSTSRPDSASWKKTWIQDFLNKGAEF